MRQTGIFTKKIVKKSTFCEKSPKSLQKNIVLSLETRVRVNRVALGGIDSVRCQVRFSAPPHSSGSRFRFTVPVHGFDSEVGQEGRLGSSVWKIETGRSSWKVGQAGRPGPWPWPKPAKTSQNQTKAVPKSSWIEP